MDAIPFVMVLIGCAPNATSCEPIATLPVAYASEASCLDARSEILSVSGKLGYSRVIAKCSPQGGRTPHKAHLRRHPTA